MLYAILRLTSNKRPADVDGAGQGDGRTAAAAVGDSFPGPTTDTTRKGGWLGGGNKWGDLFMTIT